MTLFPCPEGVTVTEDVCTQVTFLVLRSLCISFAKDAQKYCRILGPFDVFPNSHLERRGVTQKTIGEQHTECYSNFLAEIEMRDGI